MCSGGRSRFVTAPWSRRPPVGATDPITLSLGDSALYETGRLLAFAHTQRRGPLIHDSGSIPAVRKVAQLGRAGRGPNGARAPIGRHTPYANGTSIAPSTFAIFRRLAASLLIELPPQSRICSRQRVVWLGVGELRWPTAHAAISRILGPSTYVDRPSAQIGDRSYCCPQIGAFPPGPAGVRP